MKIFFTLASLGSGGAERVVSLLANQMSAMGHQIEIVCLKFNEVYYQVDSAVKVTLAMQQTRNRFTELFWLRKYVKKERPDVVIAFTEGVYCFTIAALLGTKIPVIASERLDPSAMTWKRNLLKRLFLPYADWLVVQTQSIKNYFPESIQRKTSIVYNPVNENVFRQSENAENRENRVISVGRLYPQKNQQMMIRAFAQIADRFPDWQLLIYGEGPLRNSLELLVNSLGLDGRVLLPGRTDHVIEELRKSKIFCMSSDYEGMSNSMIEAICVGLPIVTTNVSGTEDLVQEGISGFVTGIGDADGMARALEKLMEDDGLIRQMGDNCLKMKPQFLLDTVVEKWMELIRNVQKC